MLRARPAAAFALLNHILINGFFLNQGFAIEFVPFKHSVDFVAQAKRSYRPPPEARTSVA
jgi:hypothetical protein